jgi:type I restriction enzyme S subunit
MVAQSQFIEMFSCALQRKLSDVANITMGASPDSNYYNTTNSGLPFYQGKTEFGDMYIGKATLYCSEPIRIAQPNDILMSVRAPVGTVNITKEECCIGRGLASIRPNGVEQLFLYYALKLKEKDLDALGTGTTFKAINKDMLYEFSIEVGTIDKQKAFVEIAQQADKSKFDGLKSQFIEMFSGREYPQLPIRDFADITTGSTPSKSHPEYWGGSNPWVSAEDMKDKYVYDTVEKVTDKGYATCKHIPVNTLMYVCRGSIGVMAINKVECATNQSICTATCKADKCEVEFLYHSLLYKKDEIKQIGIGTNFKSLNQTTFSNLRIFLPPIEEQRRFVSITTQADKSKYLS